MSDHADPTQATIQGAGFLLRPGQSPLVLEEEWPERLRSASVLKPLLFWAAWSLPPFDSDPSRWRRLARAAITVSDNAATVQAWQDCGGSRLLAELSDRCAVAFAAEPGGRRSFGRVLINAGDTARGYASLVQAAEPAGRRLLAWMRVVPDRQTFGVRRLAAEVLGVPPRDVAVKCGWYCARDEKRMRTHAVTVTSLGERVLGTAVLTALPLDDARRRSYPRQYRGGEGVLDLHEAVAGPDVRAATGRLLSRLGSI